MSYFKAPHHRDMHYEHNVVPFGRDRADRINQAHNSHVVVEHDREEGRRLWAAYLAAIRKSVDAQEAVNQAHNAWMDYEGRSHG
jgi:hypothetical protein